MSVQTINFTSSNLKNNKSDRSYTGTCVGFLTGSALASKLIYSQMSLIKTIRGKKILIDDYVTSNIQESTEKRVALRDAEGKIMAPPDGISARTKIILEHYRSKFIGWGLLIASLCTGLGMLADRSITAVRKKEHEKDV